LIVVCPIAIPLDKPAGKPDTVAKLVLALDHADPTVTLP
jgi:hypothetical protein